MIEEKWYVAQAAFMTEAIREQVNQLNFKTFMPVMQIASTGRNKKTEYQRVTQRLLTFNYVFIYGEYKKIEEAVRSVTRLHLLYFRPGVAPGKSYGNYERKPMSVGNREMEMFIRTVSLYQNGAPIVQAKEYDLHKGDTVRIIGGTFSGVEGTLITQKGKEGGKVVVSISNLLSVATLDIEPEYIQVIRFSSENKHIYRKMDDYKPKVRQAILKRENGEELDEAEKTEIRDFIKRYSESATNTLNTEVKLKTLIFMSYVALRIDDFAKDMYHELRNNYLLRLNNVRVRSFLEEQLSYYERVIQIR